MCRCESVCIIPGRKKQTGTHNTHTQGKDTKSNNESSAAAMHVHNILKPLLLSILYVLSPTPQVLYTCTLVVIIILSPPPPPSHHHIHSPTRTGVAIARAAPSRPIPRLCRRRPLYPPLGRPNIVVGGQEK